ncbi:cytochrome-c oxidase, cbb3-type subunit III [Terasakiella sp. A23]|uniref:cytochrome-c oxidase, cbb3-type subunit III n=1 Tax=Terasakiella sp. FCG-A23 TaxID=3080561 RepID=UPI002955B870|nr:cytochrome-c oxidase, cbb3-type subunit III [Terasakiella sp. A23]MDV7341149.1 cytochrome-c oxidase, cbb3-type subunit III [Terasakiella sp. A23]
MANVEKDPVTGTDTTGHEWDGIKELDTPLPKWWLTTFYVTIIWAIGYWVVYPSWPTLNDYAKGVFETTNRLEHAKEMEEVKKSRMAWTTKFEGKEIGEVAKDAELLNYAMAGGAAIFGENCQPCHGASGSGSKGFPVLADDDWLWGGTLEAIQESVTYGIRSGHENERASDMPNLVEDETLTAAQAGQIADFVMSLSGQGTASEEGKVAFEENCAACHGEEGEGIQDLGAPRLNDGIWLFGAGKDAVLAQINKPQHGVMPSWAGRLSETEIKQVSIYVHSLGGGQ